MKAELAGRKHNEGQQSKALLSDFFFLHCGLSSLLWKASKARRLPGELILMLVLKGGQLLKSRGKNTEGQ